MRFRKNPRPSVPLFFLFAVFTLSFVAPAFPQQTATPTVQRDPQALDLINQALVALGGSANIAAIQDCVTTGTLQANPLTNPSSTTKLFKWTVSGNEFRQEVTHTSASSVFLSGHGAPVRVQNGVSTPINYHVAKANLPFFIPGYVLWTQLNNSALTFKYVGPATVEGKPALQVHISDDADLVGQLVTPQEWFLDPSTFLPLRVEYRLPTNQNAKDYIAAAFEFSAYRPLNGVMLPYNLTSFRNGNQFASISVTSATLNSGVLATTFDAATGSAQ